MPRTEVAETGLEMAERHVREFADQIIEQERMVAALSSQGRLSEAVTAHNLLVRLRTALDVAEEYLAWEQWRTRQPDGVER